MLRRRAATLLLAGLPLPAAAASDVPVVGPLVDAVSDSGNLAVIVLVMANLGLLWVGSRLIVFMRERQAVADARDAASTKLYVDTMREASDAAGELGKLIGTFRSEMALALEKQRAETERLRQDEERNAIGLRQEVARLADVVARQGPGSPARRKAQD